MLDWTKSPSVHIAARTIKQGGVIAYPTEAVWGLGCDPFNADAVFNILALKKRAPEKGLILVASKMNQFDFILDDLSSEYIATLKKSWPGPNTWIIPNNGTIPYWISGNHDGVALRVTNHPLVKAICDIYGGPIVSTSANPQGKPAAISQWQVHRYFHDKLQLDYMTKGITGGNKTPSTIRDILTGNTIRL
ncbi:MAG: L-threonylcarbamoyladenylate synthase [Cellvibrionaceae bacterium]